MVMCMLDVQTRCEQTYDVLSSIDVRVLLIDTD